MTRPLLLLPIALQACFFIGLAIFGVLSVVIYTNAFSVAGEPFTELMQAVLFIITIPASLASPPPALLMNPEYGTAIMQGMLSLKMAGLGLIIICFTLLFAVASAYTKALSLGVISDAAQKKKTSIIEMFRAGRRYWPATIRYYTPFGLLAALEIILIIPIMVIIISLYVLTQEPSPQLPGITYTLLIIPALILLLRVLSIYGDGVIVQGSERPIKDSLIYFWHNKLSWFITSIILFAGAFIVFAIDYGRGLLSLISTSLIASAMSFVFLLIFAFWRLWVAAFVVVRSQKKIPA